MNVEPLTESTDVLSFDCGDDDLNDFLLNEAKSYQRKRIANTYLIFQDTEIAAYFCLLNDKISKNEVSNAGWRKIRKLFPHNKFLSSYPSVKIGRLAVGKKFQGKGIGNEVINFIKFALSDSKSFPAFRFLTVDAYLNAIYFYEKNDFIPVMQSEPNEITKTMYFDMLQIQ